MYLEGLVSTPLAVTASEVTPEAWPETGWSKVNPGVH
jgi:hypothetical protein